MTAHEITNTKQYEMIISNEEYYEMKQQRKIEECIEQKKYLEAEAEIKNYKKMASISKQFMNNMFFTILDW